jgi:hypothetical protein
VNGSNRVRGGRWLTSYNLTWSVVRALLSIVAASVLKREVLLFPVLLRATVALSPATPPQRDMEAERERAALSARPCRLRAQLPTHWPAYVITTMR